MRRILITTLVLVACLPLSVVQAEVSVEIGPTHIPRGDAIGAKDITISNGIFAVAFAVDTAPPWGVARGGIVDIAVFKDGELGYDIASLADFMPNVWSSWPTTYQKITLEKQTASEVVVKTVRDWGEVELESTFYIRDGDSKIRIVTSMHNGGEESIDGLHSGYVVWPDGGSLFSVPGLLGINTAAEDEALADWSASYGEHWMLGLHAPFSELVAYDGRDRYLPHDLDAGETISLEAWLQIENEGSLAPLVQAEIEFQQMSSGHVRGQVVSADGEVVRRPAVVASKNGSPYAWTLGSDGNYQFELPIGDYEIYATAAGYSEGAAVTVSIAKDSETIINFEDVRAPGEIRVKVTNESSGEGLDASISIRSDNKPLIGYFGRNRFFTELDQVGEITEVIAPGTYALEISAGGGFTTKSQLIDVVVEPGKSHDVNVAIAILASPQEKGWYSADLHHHSDVLDGFTEAEFVMRSELSSGIDISFLSDHDSVANNEKMRALSDERGMQFIPGTELSPSWAHFNAFPLDAGKTVEIDTGQATVQEIFAAARDMGAELIEANHPYSSYGYFEALDNNSVPGGFDPDFELVEIVSPGAGGNEKTLTRVWEMWDEGQRAYLAGGSDVHDVWLEDSGSSRTYVHVAGDLSIDSFIEGLRVGHSFASQGPLVYPEIIFGSEISHSAGEALVLAYSIQAVSGLRSAKLIGRGTEMDEIVFDGIDTVMPIEFTVHPESNSWYSLIVEDMNGRFAYTNPVWVNVAH
jgi:hypothetical protein